MPGRPIELPIDTRAVRPVLEHVANKWTVLILTVLCPRPARFNEIMRRLNGITHKALSDSLKRLERDGLVHRRVLPTQPIGVEYTITPLGLSLREPFAVLFDWARTHGPEMARAQASHDRARARDGASTGAGAVAGG